MKTMNTEDHIKKLEKAISELKSRPERIGEDIKMKSPALFLILTTFGFVATLHGFEKLIDSIPILEEGPMLVLALGIGILIVTGNLYKKLR